MKAFYTEYASSFPGLLTLTHGPNPPISEGEMALGSRMTEYVHTVQLEEGVSDDKKIIKNKTIFTRLNITQ